MISALFENTGSAREPIARILFRLGSSVDSIFRSRRKYSLLTRSFIWVCMSIVNFLLTKILIGGSRIEIMTYYYYYYLWGITVCYKLAKPVSVVVSDSLTVLIILRNASLPIVHTNFVAWQSIYGMLQFVSMKKWCGQSASATMPNHRGHHARVTEWQKMFTRVTGDICCMITTVKGKTVGDERFE